ncbi:MAG: arylesterase, partial [Acidobacteria bacterium]|nr:arylesterase [Acidobacteriota bacterium]
GLGTDAFHHVFPEVASRVQVPLMPFLMAGALGNSPLVQRDGLHPNEAGARVIATNMWPYLEPLLRTASRR